MLPPCDQEIFICLCSCVQLKPVTRYCNKLRGQTLGLRTHTRITCEETSSVTMALSRASAFLLPFPRCFFFSAFAFIFLAQVIPFPLSSPPFHLLFPKLAPMLCQMHFNSPVDFFFSCLLCLLVFFFHTLTSQTRCSPFLGFLFFMSPFAWSVTEASLRAQPLIFQCFSKSLAILNVNHFWRCFLNLLFQFAWRVHLRFQALPPFKHSTSKLFLFLVVICKLFLYCYSN